MVWTALSLKYSFKKWYRYEWNWMQNLQCKAENEKRWMHVDSVSSKEYEIQEDELYIIQWRQSGQMIKMDENNDLFAPPLLSVLACLLAFLPSVLPFLIPHLPLSKLFSFNLLRVVTESRHLQHLSWSPIFFLKFFPQFPCNFPPILAPFWVSGEWDRDRKAAWLPRLG